MRKLIAIALGTMLIAPAFATPVTDNATIKVYAQVDPYCSIEATDIVLSPNPSPAVAGEGVGALLVTNNDAATLAVTPDGTTPGIFGTPSGVGAWTWVAKTQSTMTGGAPWTDDTTVPANDMGTAGHLWRLYVSAKPDYSVPPTLSPAELGRLVVTISIP